MNKTDLIDLSFLDLEIYSKLLDKDWRPIDAMRLRLPGLVKPKNKRKLSNDEKHTEGPEIELYKLIRYMKPKLVVETGVQNGCTSELILGALSINDNHSTLISFDCGSKIEDGDICTDMTWDGIPGQYIRTAFLHQWRLHIGNSVNIMKEKLNKDITAAKIDIFHHDSNHETEHINKELDIIYSFMKNNGLICMHDRTNRTFSLEESGKMKKIYEKKQFTIWKIVKEKNEN